MTELAALPGLESTSVRADPEPGHWIEHGLSERLMLFSGRSHRELAERIAERLKVELGAMTLKTFADGERYCRYEESIRGADVFIVQSGSPPVNDHLWELLTMIQAAKLASAKRITAVMPWFPYSRQDKKSVAREPITAKLVADCVQTAGADRVVTMDLHSGQVQGFFSIPVDHMRALPLFVSHFRDRGLYGRGVVSVSPDPGRAKVAAKFAEMLEGDPFAIMSKTRPAHDAAAVTEVIGQVRGKIAILSDDIISTGGTLVAAADALKDAGASEIYACATHGLFSGDALELLAESELREIVVTDTVPINPLTKPKNVTVQTVSGLLADTIWNVFSGESVSALFPGETLF